MTEQQIEAGFTDLAAAVDVGPPPMAELLAGGRRRLRRRRASALAVTVAACVVVGGTTVLGLGHPGGDSATTVRAAASSPGPATRTVQASPGPFTPSRALLAEGTAPDGKKWQAWAALWPASSQDQAWQQAELIWQEQHAANSRLGEPDKLMVSQEWIAGYAKYDLYVVLDGVRQPLDEVLPVPADATGISAVNAPDGLPGVTIGHRAMGGAGATDDSDPTAVVFLQVGADTAKAVLQHPDGSTTEVVPTAVGGSPVHWVAFNRSAATRGSTLRLYARDGSPTGTSTRWFA
ncbi:hypothetical protein ACFW1A_26145 [Kitasatospora sp. NPDC058965]|uniref:hypothetical protein n=1 Tax=Kitasatospora sp. NPDC058965 TaxID=3346682 RepID=UPI0036AA7A0B